MGNYITYRPSPDATGKVILSDGTVHEFDRALTVAELMLEHPQQVVVELRSAVSEKRPSPLPADEKLEIKKAYVMLPMKRGKPASLSSDEGRQVLMSANTLLRSRRSPFLPLFAKMCPAVATAGGKIKFVKQLQKTKEEVEKPPAEVKFVWEEFFPESSEGMPEFLSRQLSGKGWKPSLDTIKEKKKLTHRLFHKGFIVSN